MSARRLHLMVAVVAGSALVLQLGLVASGSAILVDTDPPALLTRILRFFAYFTVQSNLLVLVTAAWLAFAPDRDGTLFRVLRLAAVSGIAVTAVVHFLVLRPLLDLTGWNSLADTLLHVVVPLLALLTWVLAGPRPRVTGQVVALAICWPLLWLAATVAVEVATGWVPYPFLDASLHGWGGVALSSTLVAALLLAVMGMVAWLDRRLPASAVTARP